MQGINIPAGQITPDVTHVNINHTNPNNRALCHNICLESLMKVLIVLDYVVKNNVASLSKVSTSGYAGSDVF